MKPTNYNTKTMTGDNVMILNWKIKKLQLNDAGCIEITNKKQTS
jgi:hypothetical protein